MTSVRQAILNFQIDDPEAGLTFGERLSRDNGWSREFSARVVREYLRFLVLCSEAGHRVTPSDAVDQVWHLHLCYTESYWKDLCEDILGCPLHHGPTKGGVAERKKYFDWYEKTLDSYHTLFGEEPPVDIWPEPVKRFSRQNFRRVDCEENFVLPKKALSLSAAGLATGCGLAGCASGFVPASAGFGMFLFFVLIVLILVIMIRKSGGGGGGGRGTGGCGGGFFGGFGGDSDGDSGCGGGGCGGGCGS